MRNLCWPVLAALVVCGCGSEEASRKKNLRESALGGPAVLSQPNMTELSAANAAWGDKTLWEEKWRERVSQCLPPLISLEGTISPPGGAPTFNVESRLREMGVDATSDHRLVDGRGKTIYASPFGPSGREQTIDLRDLTGEVSKFTEALLTRDQLAKARANGGSISFTNPAGEPSSVSLSSTGDE